VPCSYHLRCKTDLNGENSVFTNLKKLILTSPLILLTLSTGCSKGDDTGETGNTTETGSTTETGNTTETGSTTETGTTFTPPSSDAFSSFTIDSRRSRIQQFSEEFTPGLTVTLDSGSTVTIAGNLLDSDGHIVQGSVDLEVIELTSRGDMISSVMSTMGVDENGDKSALISGGEHYVNVTQNGEQLTLQGEYRVHVLASLTGGLDMEMDLFVPEDESAGLEDEVDWSLVDMDRKIGTGGEGSDAYYWLSSSTFGWTNVDKWNNDPRDKTRIQVSVPAGFDDQNSVIYLTYDGEPTALALLDVYDENSGLFTEHYGMLPIGLEMHVIFLSVDEDNDQWLYHILPETVDEDETIAFDDVSAMTTGTEADLLAAIEALP
jgi:hypothetical protein